MSAPSQSNQRRTVRFSESSELYLYPQDSSCTNEKLYYTTLDKKYATEAALETAQVERGASRAKRTGFRN